MGTDGHEEGVVGGIDNTPSRKCPRNFYKANIFGIKVLFSAEKAIRKVFWSSFSVDIHLRRKKFE
jgi:hypothetical protein